MALTGANVTNAVVIIKAHFMRKPVVVLFKVCPNVGCASAALSGEDDCAMIFRMKIV
jgi:hypothetical protein